MANDNTIFFIVLCLFITLPFVVGTILTDFGTTTTYTDTNPHLNTNSSLQQVFVDLYIEFQEDIEEAFQDYNTGNISFGGLLGVITTGTIGLTSDWFNTLIVRLIALFGLGGNVTDFIIEVIEGVPFIGSFIVTVLSMQAVFFTLPNILPPIASTLIFSIWGFMLLYLIVKIVKDLVPTT